MLDFGWIEFIVILGIAVFVIGPDEIPSMLRGLGKMVRKIQSVKSEVSSQFDDFMHETEIDDLKDSNNKNIMEAFPTSIEEQSEINKALAEGRIPNLDGNNKKEDQDNK